MPLWIDFETRSELDLSDVGVYRYAEHPSTTVLCMAWAFHDGPVQLWRPRMAFPSIVAEYEECHAWNAQFERVIWNAVLRRQVPLLTEKPTRYWHCTMADALSMGLPGKLEQCAAVILGPNGEAKDKAGHALMMRMSKPRTTNPVTWWDDAERHARLQAYCMQDVVVERAIAGKLRSLLPAERRVWIVDQQINDAGVRLDLPLIAAAKEIADEATTRANLELSMLTKGALTTITQNTALSAYLGMSSVAKDTVAAALADPTVTGDTRRILQLRHETAMSSAAKLDSMRAMACADGRVRGTMQYHAAHTGRWGGRGIQPQNMPRGVVDNAYDLLPLIAEGRAAYDRLSLYCHPLHAISSVLRAMLVPSKGKLFSSYDYSAIEPRVTAWLAGQEDALQRYRNGEDEYLVVAAEIFQLPMSALKKYPHRQLGKATLLGCFAPDTLVLTLRGWVRLGSVTSTDHVWDGVEWVTHSGVIDQGEQETTVWGGIRCTPNHDVLTGSTWSRIRDIQENTQLRQSALSSASLPSPATTSVCAAGFARLKCAVRAVTSARWMPAISVEASVLGARSVLQKWRNKLLNITTHTSRFALTQSIGSVYLIVFPPQLIGARTPTIEGTSDTVVGASAYARRGDMAPKEDALFWRIWSRCRVGMTRLLKLIESTTNVVTRLITSGLRSGGRTLETSDRSMKCSENSTHCAKKMRVYDLGNCGPRSRFTIMSAYGPVIVHNCIFGLGWRGLQRAAAKGPYFLDIDETLARTAVDAFRDKWDRVPAMWKALEAAVLSAVETPRVPVPCGRLTFIADGAWLLVKLPSGRLMTYARPTIREDIMPWGATKDVVYVEGQNSMTKQWESYSLWGGFLTENFTQAVARDVMADRIVALTEAGMLPVLSVHDEVVCEVDDDAGHQTMGKIMQTVPTWAEGLPIAIEGWCSNRYQK